MAVQNSFPVQDTELPPGQLADAEQPGKALIVGNQIIININIKLRNENLRIELDIFPPCQLVILIIPRPR